VPAAERDLRSLLVAMKPALDPREWVFCTLDREAPIDGLQPLLTFRENEGVTVVVERESAESRGLSATFPCRRITLRVHSDLEAVGFLARITAELAKYAIPANAVSAFYHDHLFVPADRGEEALRVLEDLSSEEARRALGTP
jgi:hypothetical protein